MHGTLSAVEMESQSPTINRWCALLVASGQERKVCIWLRRRQYSPYWARYKKLVKLNRHRRAQRWMSVIPGYLFLPYDENINWRLIEEVGSVRGFMRNGSTVIQIPNDGAEGIERIREMEETANKDAKLIESGIPFGVGQKVLIKGKNWENEGIITRIVSKSKCSVKTHFFGAEREIELPFGVLEAVYEDKP